MPKLKGKLESKPSKVIEKKRDSSRTVTRSAMSGQFVMSPVKSGSIPKSKMVKVVIAVKSANKKSKG